MSRSAIGFTIRTLTRTASDALASERVAAQKGLLQALDARVRITCAFALLVSALVCRKPIMLLGLLLLATAMALISRVSLLALATRVWSVTLVFTGVIAAPALFLTPGRSVMVIPVLSLEVTETGLHTALMLILRVLTATTLTTSLVLSSPWNQLLRAFRWFRLPAEAITMLAITHRYIFLLMENANQMFLSRECRNVGKLEGRTSREVVARTAGVLLLKTADLSHGVYLAMLSRGFQGEVRTITRLQMKSRDYIAVLACIMLCATLVLIGR